MRLCMVVIRITKRVEKNLKEVLPSLETVNYCTHFADISQSCLRNLMKLFGGGRLISNKPFDFGADPDQDPYPG